MSNNPNAPHPDDEAEAPSEIVPGELLERYGGSIVTIERNQVLFEQGDRALFFHQVRDGMMKMSVCNDRGREFVQGYFGPGQSFGEPPFLQQSIYPATAIALEKSHVWRCAHDNFIELLRGNFDVHLRVTRVLSARLVYKAMMLSEIAVEEAGHRIATIIDYFRRSDGVGSEQEYRVPFTRQQLADMTGLRVETVIRTVKSMEEKGILSIDEGKIVWLAWKAYHLFEQETKE